MKVKRTNWKKLRRHYKEHWVLVKPMQQCYGRGKLAIFLSLLARRFYHKKQIASPCENCANAIKHIDYRGSGLIRYGCNVRFGYCLNRVERRPAGKQV